MDATHELIRALGMEYQTTRVLLIAGLIMARCVPLVFMTPFLAGQIAPGEVKMSLGILFTILVWPLVNATLLNGPAIPVQALPYTLLFLKEVFVGFTIGYAHATIFAILETAGRLIDTVRGSAMAEVMVPTSKLRATPLGSFYSQMLLLVFVALNGHAIFLETFFRSFFIIPLNTFLAPTEGLLPLINYLLRTTGEIMGSAVILSAPAVVATLIADLVFGILNRVAPQLNAYFMAMPVKALGALILMLASLRPFMQRLSYFVVESLISVQRTIELLGTNHHG